MEQVIEIKAFFGKWNQVNKKHAYDFISGLLKSSQAIDKNNDEEVNNFVSNHLKGISWNELKEEHL